MGKWAKGQTGRKKRAKWEEGEWEKGISGRNLGSCLELVQAIAILRSS
jgi:hypothetical protein